MIKIKDSTISNSPAEIFWDPKSQKYVVRCEDEPQALRTYEQLLTIVEKWPFADNPFYNQHLVFNPELYLFDWLSKNRPRAIILSTRQECWRAKKFEKDEDEVVFH